MMSRNALTLFLRSDLSTSSTAFIVNLNMHDNAVINLMTKILRYRYSGKVFLLYFIMLLIVSTAGILYAQETVSQRSAIKTGLGVGINDGHRETGLGMLYSVGWQKSYGSKDKLRINPNMMIGGFNSMGITDTRQQFYQVSSLSFKLHYDLIRYKAISLVTTAGGFINYSRGLLGTGGDSEFTNRNSEYFARLYYGLSTSVGIRIDPKISKLAYEIRPLNLHFGNNNFLLGYLMVGVDFKLGG